MQIRLPNHMGIAGTVFTSGKTINIPHAYADLRFNPAFDKQDRLLHPLDPVRAGHQQGRQGDRRHPGAEQARRPLHRRGRSPLKAFTAQIAISLENAKLFDDVQNMKNYNESMLESMSNGVITLNDDGRIVTCNAAGLRILKVTRPEICRSPVGGVLHRRQRLGAGQDPGRSATRGLPT